MSGLNVIIVEDQPLVRRLIKNAAEASQHVASVNEFGSGESALDHVEGSPPQDCLFLLDNHLPGISGTQLTRRLRTFAGMEHSPVVILTLGDSEEEVEDAYDAGANVFITKPVIPGELEQLITTAIEFWARVRLPRAKEAMHV